MFDIKWIRDNAEAFDAGLARRKLDGMSAGLIELDKTRRDAETRAQEIQAERNKLSKQIGVAKASGEDASEIIAEVSRSKQAQSEAEEEARIATDKLNDVLMGIPNLPLDDVP
ncbi:MAG: serine--tRNA ligase, partial [Rhodospirillaceae bacterium]|nr:serine--tRNA ligase [Rhodospirillaceae bacterium]